MERNKTIDIPNHNVGQKMKKGTPESIFFPVKNVAAFRAKVIQHKIDSKDIDTGCHSKSYLEVSLKYADIQKKNAMDMSALMKPSHIFLDISIFLILISLKLRQITIPAIAAKNKIVNTTDSTKVKVKSPAQILRGTRATMVARKINQEFLRFILKTSNKTYF